MADTQAPVPSSTPQVEAAIPMTGVPTAYDFRRATRFSAEHLRGLSRLVEHLATLLQTYMTAYLRAHVRATRAALEAMAYEEFIRQTSDVVAAVVEMAPLRGNALLTIDQRLAMAIVDRLLGGPGLSSGQSRAPTEIELRVLRRACPMFMEAIQEALGPLVELRVEVASLETSTQFLRIVSASEAVVVATQAVNIGEVHGQIAWCLPYPLLEEVLPRLSTQHLVSGAEGGPMEQEARERLWERVKRAPVQVTAELGTARVTGGDLLTLEVGDCIPLDQRENAPITVRLGGSTALRAWVRERDRHLTLRVAELPEASIPSGTAEEEANKNAGGR